MKGRLPETEEEKKFWELCYKIGMQNGWCSGRYAMQDGEYIAEEDRLNKGSVIVIDDIHDLKEFFAGGCWTLGTAVIYKNLCFIQQISGGDEWLAIRKTKNGAESFDSITFGPMARDYQGYRDAFYLPPEERKETEDGRIVARFSRRYYEGRFEKLIERLCSMPDEELHNHDWVF